MAQSHEGEAKRKFIGPLFNFLKMGFIGGSIILAVQLWVNPPEKRAVVACFAPYKVARAVNYGFMKLFPKEYEAQIAASNKIESLNESCIYYVSKIPKMS